MSDVINKLIGALQEVQKSEGYKHDLPTGYTLSTNWMHGQNGIFGAAGIDRDVFSSRVRPRGILSALPAFARNDTHPLVGYLTGVTASGTDTQEGPCGDPPQAGNIKSCLTGSAFGRLMLATQPIQMDRIGEIVNRGEMTDLRVVNDPVNNMNLAVPMGAQNSASAALRQEILAKFYTLGAAFEEKLCPMVWNGNPTNNDANGGYMEFSGFESLVTTGHVDVTTNTSCPSLDSDIKDANYLTVEDNAAAIFNILLMVWRYVNHNASTMGFGDVQWTWVMRDTLFRELSDYWPCVYASYRCNATSNDLSNKTDAMLMRQMSDAMYNGRYLRVDGRDVPVIIDDCIPEDTNTTNANVPSGSFASDAYLLPMSVNGGIRTTFMEFFNFAGPMGVQEAINLGFVPSTMRVTDGGRFMWTQSQEYTCLQWQALTKLRLRLLTPMLAGRVQNIMYSPLQHFRDPFPSDPYFVNGGNTTGDNDPYYSAQ